MSSFTLYRFRIELSDVDRGHYEALDFRIALHPSETPVYLLSRVFAFALNAQEGLAFAPGGLSDPDAPALSAPGEHGRTALWIEIGHPSARKLHKASKAAEQVKVYTYKDPTPWLREIQGADIHAADRLEIHSFDPKFLERAAEALERDNRWSLLHSEGSLVLSMGERAETSELKSLRLT